MHAKVYAGPSVPGVIAPANYLLTPSQILADLEAKPAPKWNGVSSFFLEKSGLQLLIGSKPPGPTQNFRPSYGPATGPTTNLRGGEEGKKEE